MSAQEEGVHVRMLTGADSLNVTKGLGRRRVGNLVYMEKVLDDMRLAEFVLF